MKEALYYKKLKENKVQCLLCPHFCLIKNNQVGKCNIRKNNEGILYSLSYNHPLAINLDNIEKKPLYHFLPGTKTFSIGMAGCNLKCLNCQNWELSQRGYDNLQTKETTSSEILIQALHSKCPSISYTYSEPLISYEYVLDITKLSKKKGLKNILVSNGFINPEPLKNIIKYIDAANIDLKSFKDETYKTLCGAKLSPILDTIRYLYENKVHVEITTLLIPNINDSEKELEEIAKFISNISKDIPWHISAYYPSYKLDEPPTPLKLLKQAEKTGKKYLNYVYLGNIQNDNNTYCPKCKSLLVDRNNNKILIKNNKCFNCQTEVKGIWE